MRLAEDDACEKAASAEPPVITLASAEDHGENKLGAEHQEHQPPYLAPQCQRGMAGGPRRNNAYGTVVLQAEVSPDSKPSLKPKQPWPSRVTSPWLQSAIATSAQPSELKWPTASSGLLSASLLV
jgi:hypothetical protein